MNHEGLSVAFTALHYHYLAAGSKVTYNTDHQPPPRILLPIKPVPEVLSPRMGRWGVRLYAFDYNRKYGAGKAQQKADALIWLTLPEDIEEPSPPEVAFLFNGFPRTTTHRARYGKNPKEGPCALPAVLRFAKWYRRVLSW